MKNYKDLDAWRVAVDLAVTVYELTRAFPHEERYGLTAQMRRSSVSVAGNIAEGYGRITVGECLQFLGHARGSLYELETQLIVSQRAGVGVVVSDTAAECERQIERTRRLLNGIIRHVGMGRL